MDFGVVITAHNCAEFIEHSVKSVFEQTLQPREVLVVDDHSEDGTFETLQRLKEKYPTLRVERNGRNLERCASRNRGAELLTAKFVCFLDCDDLWLPDYLEKTKAQLTLGNFEASFGLPSLFIDPAGQPIRKKKKPKEPFEALLYGGKVGYPSGSCFKRETFLRLGGYKERYLMREDWEIFLRFHTEGLGIAFIPLHRYAIREHPNRTSRGNRKFLEATLRVVEDYLPKTPSGYREYLLHHAAVQCFRFGDKRCGFKYLRELLKGDWKRVLTFKGVWEIAKRIFR